MKATVIKHELQFKKTSRTSRGEITAHNAFILCLEHEGGIGYGEASPLKGLSIDDRTDFETTIIHVARELSSGIAYRALDLDPFPSIRFAIETASAGLKHKNPFQIFQNSFIQGTEIEVNGLIWMDQTQVMYEEALNKISDGFTCLKFKIGAMDFDDECRMLEKIRKQFSTSRISIRLDANGAFKDDDAIYKLKELSRFKIHSIEQPIQPRQWEVMAELCAKSAVPIALDEELIGLIPLLDGKRMIQKIKPTYLILKPTLIGGFEFADQWIKLAEDCQVGWWATSALESNIGLNAIAQWCRQYPLKLPQGLGTGALYTNNIQSPLEMIHGSLIYNASKNWDLPTSRVIS